MAHRCDSVGGVSVQLSTACLICMLVYWVGGKEMGIAYPQALIPCALALYGLNRLFLRGSGACEPWFS